MKTAEEILQKHCPSMSNLFLDSQGKNFRDRIVQAMKEYAKEVAREALKNAAENASLIESVPHSAVYDTIDKQSILSDKNIPEI